MSDMGLDPAQLLYLMLPNDEQVTSDDTRDLNYVQDLMYSLGVDLPGLLGMGDVPERPDDTPIAAPYVSDFLAAQSKDPYIGSAIERLRLGEEPRLVYEDTKKAMKNAGYELPGSDDAAMGYREDPLWGIITKAGEEVARVDRERAMYGHEVARRAQQQAGYDQFYTPQSNWERDYVSRGVTDEAGLVDDMLRSYGLNPDVGPKRTILERDQGLADASARAKQLSTRAQLERMLKASGENIPMPPAQTPILAEPVNPLIAAQQRPEGGYRLPLAGQEPTGIYAAPNNIANIEGDRYSVTKDLSKDDRVKLAIRQMAESGMAKDYMGSQQRAMNPSAASQRNSDALMALNTLLRRGR